MKIALIGYGKMGRSIETKALERGHEIVLRISSMNAGDLTEENLRKADIAIEFTNPATVVNNILICIEAAIPVVCGTTGWNNELPMVHEKIAHAHSGFLHSSNFSLGMAMFFEINDRLASLMSARTEYKVSIDEMHHLQKKDAPSGTAISLANQILAHNKSLTGWTLGYNKINNLLPIAAHRSEGVVGTHKVNYTSSIDDIEIIHTAHNRDGFAIGAVLAAEFLIGKHGVYAFRDVLLQG